MSGVELGKALGKHDVYVSASAYENCPNHILESLACEIPTYAISLGGASLDIVGPDHVFESWEELKNILLTKNFAANEYTPASWQDSIVEYLDIYQHIKNRRI